MKPVSCIKNKYSCPIPGSFSGEYTSVLLQTDFTSFGIWLKIIYTLIFLHISICIYAQLSVTNTAPYQYLNPWLEGNNSAGLIFNRPLPFSNVEASYAFTNGNFRSMTDAPIIHRYKITSESYRHLKKIRLYGRISYAIDSKKQSQWSAMLEPQAHLINFGDTIAGRQRCEAYNIAGKIAIPISRQWTLGGNLDYYARSNSKDTDPRNKNSQTDLLFSPSILFSAGEFHTGVNFIYHRTNEEVTYSMINQQVQDIRTFYPLWFYFNESFQNGTNNTRIYKNERIGGALQFYWGGNQLKWFNELCYKGSTEITDISINQGRRAGETVFREFFYRGKIRLLSDLHHTLKPEYVHLTLINFDNLQGKLTNTTEQKVEDYGKVKRSAMLTDQLTLTYTLSQPYDSLANSWAIHACFGYWREKSIFLVYPARYYQPITQITYRIGYERRIPLRNKLLEISTQLEYITGHGSLPNAYSENNTSLPEVHIAQKTDLLLRDFQYKTAENLKMNLHLQYTYPVSQKYALFCTAGTTYIRNLSTTWAGTNRFNLRLSTGLNF